MTVAEFMELSLMHPELGYYRSGSRIGKEGDFITSPEISQMFGELLGMALAAAWMEQGRPREACLVEPGPGKGSMMVDLLRAAASVPGFRDAVHGRLFLIEANASFRRMQGERLAPHRPTWIESINDLPKLPIYLVANEFFDCLPVRVFMRTEGGWQERFVAAAGQDLRFVLGPVAGGAGVPGDDETAARGIGSIIETSHASRAMAEDIGRHIGRYGGCAFIVDYGDRSAAGDTLQAVRNHSRVPVLDSPGRDDLTAHVDFGAISAAAGRYAKVTDVVPQGVFLERLGVTARAAILAQGLKGPELESHVAAHRRLTHPDEMGNLFKAIAVAPENGAAIPGFA